MFIQVAALAFMLLGNSSATVVPVSPPPPPSFDSNLQWDRLTEQQRANLRAIAEAERLRQKGATFAERCYADEAKRLGKPPTDLEKSAIDAKCREIGSALK